MVGGPWYTFKEKLIGRPILVLCTRRAMSFAVSLTLRLNRWAKQFVTMNQKYMPLQNWHYCRWHHGRCKCLGNDYNIPKKNFLRVGFTDSPALSDNISLVMRYPYWYDWCRYFYPKTSMSISSHQGIYELPEHASDYVIVTV